MRRTAGIAHQPHAARRRSVAARACRRRPTTHRACRL